MRDVRLATAPFDPHEEMRQFSHRCGDAGGIVSFTGLVREEAGSEVESLELRHFEPLTLPGMTDLAGQAPHLGQRSDSSPAPPATAATHSRQRTS